MSGMPSIPVRLQTVERYHANHRSNTKLLILAEEFGLDPDEIRAEAEAFARHRRQYGPEPEDVQIGRLANELDLDPDETKAEVELIRNRLRERGVL